MVYTPARQSRGLDESVIRSIPIFQFKKLTNNGDSTEEGSLFECAVCLNEFQEEEKLRRIPTCSHVFHIDCIDVWLQNNANCPLCRTSISISTGFQTRDQIIAPSSSPQDPNPYTESSIGGEDDFVVIELQEESSNSADQSLLTRRERLLSSEDISGHLISPWSRKVEQSIVPKKVRKFHHVSSMGDECIDIRGKDDHFSIQPIRRSFSMGSSNDRQLYLAIQAIIQQNRHVSCEVISPSEGCSSRVRRSFFSFGHGRGSRNAVLPIQMEL